MFKVASVPYVNARPLALAMERFGWADVRYEVPSKLPALLDAGEADAVLVSSFDALRTPGRTMAANCAIASLGPADSVRLFSKVPIPSIRSLALDQSSLTSNHLALSLLAEVHGVHPRASQAAPDLHEMLRDWDACILIGDKGLEADGSGLEVLDLGSAWREWSGKPFVWAVWVGTCTLSPQLVEILNRSKEWGLSHLDEAVQDAMDRAGWSEEVAEHYLGHTMNYDLTEAHLEGLELFRRLLVKHGFIEDRMLPRIVQRELSPAR